jgi:hypothetical protein
VPAAEFALHAEVLEAALDGAVRAGMAKDWARRLPTELHRRGLRNIWTDCETPLFEGGSVQSQFWRLTVAQARDLVIADGITLSSSTSGTVNSASQAAGSPAWPSSRPAGGVRTGDRTLLIRATAVYSRYLADADPLPLSTESSSKA